MYLPLLNERTPERDTHQRKMNEDRGKDEVIASFQQLLNDLLLYTPGTLFEKGATPPTKDEFAHINSEEALAALKLLAKYVRPRHEVLHIRKAVNAALKNGVAGQNIYSRHVQLSEQLASLNAAKASWEEKLKSVMKAKDEDDDQKTLLRNIMLENKQKQLQYLEIFHEHLQMVLSNSEKPDNQMTLVSRSL
jgi:hypothetical protein